MTDKIIPIITCALNTKSINILKASVESYAKEHPLIVHFVEKSSFGESYNMALEEAFKVYDEVIISNDDIVLTPTSVSKLLEDVQKLKTVVPSNELGFVATMADTVRIVQNIRFKLNDEDRPISGKWASESLIKCVPVIAPIFAWISKEAFQAAKFPPINWWSDDVICEDLSRLGFKHFVSSSYVHHVGSNSIGIDYVKLENDALPWVKEHRPEYLQLFEDRKYFKCPK